MIWRILVFVLLTQVAAWGQQISGGTGGGSSIVSGTTSTSGCTDNSVLASRSSLVACDGAILMPSGGPVTIGNGGATIRQLVFTPNSGVSFGIGMANSGSQLVFFQNTSPVVGIGNGLVLSSNASFQWSSASGNVGTTNDVNFTRNSAGVLQIGTTATNASGSLLLTNITPSGTITNTGIASDATHTDTTVCQDTTSHAFLSGSGTLGICLGTSGAQFKRLLPGPMSIGLVEIEAIPMHDYFYLPGYGDNGARIQYGPTAQEVEAIPSLAHLVGHNADGAPVNYDAGALLMASIRSIQQLSARVAELEHAK